VRMSGYICSILGGTNVTAMTRGAKIVVAGLLAATVGWLPSSLAAQSSGTSDETPRLMVSPFRGNAQGIGPETMDAVINRLTSDIPQKSLIIIPKKYVCDNLKASGFSCDSMPDPITSKLLATTLRADEYLEGTVSKTPTGYRLDARMVLTRDNTMVQPLPPVEGKKIGDLASKVSKEFQEARKQLADERKCELAIRDNQLQQAAKDAQAANAAYPQSTIGRVCLANAYLAMKMPPDSVIAVASKAIEIDPHNMPALRLAADAYKAKYDQTKDTTALDKAVDTWAAELAADPKNTRLVQDVTEKIAASGRAQRAKPIIIQAVADNPGDPSLIHLKWLILQATKDYAEAAETGEEMVKTDTAAADTTYFIREAALYALANQPQKAAETTAKGVAKFKDNATLWALDSQMQRAAGQLQAAVDAAKQALKLNPKAEHGWLRLANAELDLNQPDSALVALRQALANGEDSSAVGQFVLALGSKAYAQADSLKPPTIDAYQHAEAELAFADSIKPSPQAKFLRGVAALKAGDLAVRQNEKDKQCDLAKTAQTELTTAQIYIQQGGQADPQTAGKLLQALPQYDPAVKSQLKRFCKGK
jgi:tetratricopeptide (TPR) repeat protein